MSDHAATLGVFTSLVDREIRELTSGQFNIHSACLPEHLNLRSVWSKNRSPAWVADDIVEHWIGVGIIPLE